MTNKTKQEARATAYIHAQADARCKRNWNTDGCCCGACNIARKLGIVFAVEIKPTSANFEHSEIAVMFHPSQSEKLKIQQGQI